MTSTSLHYVLFLPLLLSLLFPLKYLSILFIRVFTLLFLLLPVYYPPTFLFFCLLFLLLHCL
jgi:hypothetical protein